MSRLGELTGKVDAFFARVAERHGADMACDTGCSDCCHVRLTITRVEAAAIRDLVSRWSREQRAGLADVGPVSRCAALDASGRCKIYDARPLVCRSHGVPIRLRQGSLPVVQACHHNFVRTAPDPDCILDQATLSATLLAIDELEHPAAEIPAVPTAPPARPAPASGRRASSTPHRGPTPGLIPAGRAAPIDPGRASAAARRVELAGLLAELAAI